MAYIIINNNNNNNNKTNNNLYHLFFVEFGDEPTNSTLSDEASARRIQQELRDADSAQRLSALEEQEDIAQQMHCNSYSIRKLHLVQVLCDLLRRQR
jgi:hypothetical protein